MKVYELIELLKEFNQDMPIVIREAVKDGGYIDYIPHEPREFYPGGKVCLSTFVPDEPNLIAKLLEENEK